MGTFLMVRFGWTTGRKHLIKSQNRERGRWRLRSPLVPQWVNIGDGWIVGLLIQSPLYLLRPSLVETPEDISNFFHIWDE
jgi:hypothetical protein